MSLARWFFIGLLAGWSLISRAAEPAGIELRALSEQGDFEYDEASGVATSPAGVQVTYGDATLTAHRIHVDRNTGEVTADGQVRLQRGAEVWTSEHLTYNFYTRAIDAGHFRAGYKPIFVGGESLAGGVTNQSETATNAFVTSDDFSEPSYRVKAKSLIVVPGEYIEAHKATLSVGGVPIFYFPKYRRYLNRPPGDFEVLPGYRSLYGAYALGKYHWSLTTNINGTVRLDLRSKRGVGGGLDLNSDFHEYGTNLVKTYYTYDNEPGTNSLGRNIDPNRWRVSAGHSAFLTTNFTFKASVNAQSDEYITRDFFEREYRSNIQPQSFAEFDKLWPNFTLDFLAQGQLYDFYETTERLPDIKFTGTRQQLGVSPFYYESESSAAYLRHRYAYDTQPAYEAFRADTYHQLLLPQTFFGWLNVAPRAGGRFTYYGEEQGIAATLDEQRRWVFNTGMEVSTKASRLWPTAKSRLLEVQGLRHIIEPSVNYVFVPDPTTAPQQLPQFDPELNSFRLLPVDFPDYNAIDSIDTQNAFRFGLRNRVQTKRGDGVDNLANWALFMDWRLDPRPDQRTFSDLYSDLDLKPRTWMTLSSELRYDINETNLRMANHLLTLEPNSTWSWTFGHRYLLEVPGQGPESGNNLILSSLRLKLNENWSLRAAQQFEARDGNMEEQYYTVQRDFRSWTGALVFRLRDPRVGENDFTVAVMLSLKAFPRYGLGSEREVHRTLLE